MTQGSGLGTFFGPNRFLATKTFWGPHLIWCTLMNFLRYRRFTDQHFAPKGAVPGFERTRCSHISSCKRLGGSKVGSLFRKFSALSCKLAVLASVRKVA